MRDLYIKGAAASTPPVGINLLQTGQTTSYRSGDDITRGRLTNFTTLSANNPFGNTNRFTSEVGTQTYTNNIVIDWSTYDNSKVLCYYIGDISTTRNWNTAIDLKLSATIGGLTGWNLWNVREVMNVCDFSKKPYKMNYAPFNFGSGQRYFLTSTDYDGSNIYATDLGSALFISTTKTNSLYTVYVRVCTVSGTTLS
jgi:hypothetical protein